RGIYVADSLVPLADIAREQGDLSKAEEYYRQALTIREKLTPGSIYYAEALAGLGAIMQRKREFDIAAAMFARTLDTLEDQISRLGGTEETRSDFRAKYARYYLDYIDLLIAQNQPELAFQVVERFRARSLLEMLGEAHVDVRTGVDPNLLGAERSLRRA